MLSRVLATLALILLAAHSLRVGEMGAMAAWLLLAGLGWTRLAWARLALMAGLVVGLFVWTQTAVDLIHFRLLMGGPWFRLVGIMAGVVLFDLLALALVFRDEDRFPLQADKAGWRFGAGALVVALLVIARSKASLPLLLADRYLPGWGLLQVALLGLYAVWIAGFLLEPAKIPLVRSRVWRLFSLVFFAQLGLGLLGLDRMLMTGRLHLPVPALIVAGPIFRGHGFFMPMLYGVSLLLVGPAWCSHLCYIGAWDDLASRGLGRPKALPTWARWGRVGTLALVLLAAVGLRLAGAATLTAIWLAAAFGLIGVGIMAFVSRRRGSMVHCTAWCPIGLLSNILGKINPWRLRIDTETCTGCQRCVTLCRYDALDKAMLERGRPRLSCALCGDCLAGCRHGAIGFRFPGLSTDAARAAFVTLVVALHAVFLGVARI